MPGNLSRRRVRFKWPLRPGSPACEAGSAVVKLPC